MKKSASKSRRPLKIVVGILVVLVVVVLALEFAIDSMIRSSFRLAVPAFLGVKEASVETLDFSFFKKHTLLLENLHIGNPEGYKTDGIFDLAKVDVKIKLSSLFSQAIEIEHVWIDGVEVTYEKGLTSSNLADLLARFDSGDKPEKPAEESPKKEKSSSKAVVIRDLNIEGTRLHPTITLAQGIAPSIPLPPIHLTDIGAPSKEGEPAGITVAGALRLVLQALLSSVGGTAGATVDLAVDGVKAVGSGIAAAASFLNPFDNDDNEEAAPEVEAAAAEAAESIQSAAEAATESAADSAADAISAASDKAVESVQSIGSGIASAISGLNPFSDNQEASPEPPASEAEPAPEAETAPDAPAPDSDAAQAADAISAAAESATDAISEASGKAVEGVKALGGSLSSAIGGLNPFSSGDSDKPAE
jgi:chemotaxis protein histidine kinase CheA